MNREERRTAEPEYNQPRGFIAVARVTNRSPVGRANITVKIIMTREAQINRGMRFPGRTTRRTRGVSVT